MGIARLAGLVLLVPALVRAEPPQNPLGILVNAGVGEHISSQPENYATVEHDLSLSLKLDVGYRITERAMVGIHAALASAVTQHDSIGDPMFDTEWKDSVRPLQVGVSGVYAPRDRVFVEGWAGAQHAWVATLCTTMSYHDSRPDNVSCPDSPSYQSVGGLTMAFGGTLGVDAMGRGDHRLTLSLSASHTFDASTGEYIQRSYTQFSIDVGYRFWAR